MAVEDYLDDFRTPLKVARERRQPVVNPAVQAHNALIVAKGCVLVEVQYLACTRTYTYWTDPIGGLRLNDQVVVRAAGSLVVATVRSIRKADSKCLALPYALSQVLLVLKNRLLAAQESRHASAARRVLVGKPENAHERLAVRLLEEEA